ncbi:replication initiation factor domain-containing protein [Variovorax sp. OK605]|uniref:replication initiation factor domain-containing protein n=1 Tax=Variovorax sp. OK605 TaxID=1855317 RepID=UPI001160A683|nr:replication initiation factor domain-containing protein [Variovorax sp. OK605]
MTRKLQPYKAHGYGHTFRRRLSAKRAGASEAPHQALSAAPCPPALTGGESLALERGAKVDWLTCTWYPDPDEHVPATILGLLREVVGPSVVGVEAPGMFGYQEGCRFFVELNGTQVNVARVDFGGAHHDMRARFDLSGTGCSKVASWQAVQDWIERQAAYKLTRVDLAVDLLMGEYTVEHARDWYLAGRFNAGGRMPRHSTPGDWLCPKHGRTLEVGRRENGKMLRAYEKGRQLGDTASPWTRFEVELRNIDRDLPLDILTRCDHYFVGAYRCLEDILAAAAERIRTHQVEGEIALDKLTEHARSAYGQLFDVLRLRLTADEVLQSLSRPGVPRRLEKSSLARFNLSASPAEYLKKANHEDQRDRV